MAIRYNQTLERLGERIEQLRKERGITQEELASTAGISHSYYWSIIKSKRNLSIKVAINIANALDVSLAELFDF